MNGSTGTRNVSGLLWELTEGCECIQWLTTVDNNNNWDARCGSEKRIMTYNAVAAAVARGTRKRDSIAFHGFLSILWLESKKIVSLYLSSGWWARDAWKRPSLSQDRIDLERRTSVPHFPIKEGRLCPGLTYQQERNLVPHFPRKRRRTGKRCQKPEPRKLRRRATGKEAGSTVRLKRKSIDDLFYVSDPFLLKWKDYEWLRSGCEKTSIF